MQIIAYMLALLSIVLLAVDRILKKKSLFSLAGSFLGLLSGVLFVLTSDVSSLLLLASEGTIFALLLLVMAQPYLKLPSLLKYLPAVMFLVMVPVFSSRNGFPMSAVVPGATVIAVAYVLIRHGWIDAPKKDTPQSEPVQTVSKSSEYEEDLLPHALLLFLPLESINFLELQNNQLHQHLQKRT